MSTNTKQETEKYKFIITVGTAVAFVILSGITWSIFRKKEEKPGTGTGTGIMERSKAVVHPNPVEKQQLVNESAAPKNSNNNGPVVEADERKEPEPEPEEAEADNEENKEADAEEERVVAESAAQPPEKNDDNTTQSESAKEEEPEQKRKETAAENETQEETADANNSNTNTADADADADADASPTEEEPRKQPEFCTMFDVFNEKCAVVTTTEKTKWHWQTLKNPQFLEFEYEPQSNTLICSQTIADFPEMRIFVELAPQQSFMGCINVCNETVMNENTLMHRAKERGVKSVIFSNFITHGFSGRNNLASGTVVLTGYGKKDTAIQTQDGTKAGTTLVMKYDAKENKFSIFRQEYKHFNTDEMELVYETNEVDRNYHYCIGYKHDKSIKSRKFSYVVMVPKATEQTTETSS